MNIAWLQVCHDVNEFEGHVSQVALDKVDDVAGTLLFFVEDNSLILENENVVLLEGYHFPLFHHVVLLQ